MVKNPLQCRRPQFDPWVGKILWRRERLPTPVFWPGEFHGLCSPWGRKELDMIERLSLFRECGKEAQRVLRCGSPWRQGIQCRPLLLCNSLLAVHFHSAWVHLGIGTCLGGASHRRTENHACSLVSPRQSRIEIRPAGHVAHRICSFTWDLWCMEL